MPTVTETLRQQVSDEGAYRTAKETGLQYRVMNEFAKGARVPSGTTIDKLAEHFELELKPNPNKKSKGGPHRSPQAKEINHDHDIDRTASGGGPHRRG